MLALLAVKGATQRGIECRSPGPRLVSIGQSDLCVCRMAEMAGVSEVWCREPVAGQWTSCSRCSVLAVWLCPQTGRQAGGLLWAPVCVSVTVGLASGTSSFTRSSCHMLG